MKRTYSPLKLTKVPPPAPNNKKKLLDSRCSIINWTGVPLCKPESKRTQNDKSSSSSSKSSNDDDDVLYAPPEKKARTEDDSLSFKPYKMLVGLVGFSSKGSPGVPGPWVVDDDDIKQVKTRIEELLNRRNAVYKGSNRRLEVDVKILNGDDEKKSLGLKRPERLSRDDVIMDMDSVSKFYRRWIQRRNPSESKERPVDIWVIPNFIKPIPMLSVLDMDDEKYLSEARDKVLRLIAAHKAGNLPEYILGRDHPTLANNRIDSVDEMMHGLIYASPLFQAKRVFRFLGVGFASDDWPVEFYYEWTGGSRPEDLVFDRLPLRKKRQWASDVEFKKKIDAHPMTMLLGFDHDDPRTADAEPKINKALIEVVRDWNDRTALKLWEVHPEVVARQVGQFTKLDLGLTRFRQNVPNPSRPSDYTPVPTRAIFPVSLAYKVGDFVAGKASDLKESKDTKDYLVIGVCGLSTNPLTQSRLEVVIGLINQYGHEFLPPGAGIVFKCLDELPLFIIDDDETEEEGDEVKVKKEFLTEDSKYHKGDLMNEIFWRYANAKTADEPRQVHVWMLDYPGLSRSPDGYNFESDNLNDHVLQFHHLVKTKAGRERIFALKRNTDVQVTGPERIISFSEHLAGVRGPIPLQFDKAAQTYVTNDKQRIRVLDADASDEASILGCLKWLLHKHPAYKDPVFKEKQVRALPMADRLPDDMRDMVKSFTAMKFHS
jgi:hypothetical protein